MLYCLRRGMQLLWCEFISNKVNKDPGVWDHHMQCRARSWANEWAHVSENRPLNSKAGFYSCSELWKPLGQKIYMKNAVSMCSHVKVRIFVCVFFYVWLYSPYYMCVFLYMCNSGKKREVSKRNLVISGIYHHDNQLQRKCQGELETLITGIKNQYTELVEFLLVSTEGWSIKFIITTPQPNANLLAPSPILHEFLLSLIKSTVRQVIYCVAMHELSIEMGEV